MNSEVVMTFDIDWAPDFVIDFVAQHLTERQIKATWFVTHSSPAVDRLRRYPELFELGIHPNFRSHSTHGNTPAEILEYCLNLVPDAVSMRTHSLVQSTPLLAQILTETSITRDVSIFLPHTSHIHPHELWWAGRRLLRIPYYWEEDFEMERPEPCWHVEPLLEVGDGIKIFDFHPIHLYLNSADMKPYNDLRQRFPKMSDILPGAASKYIQKGNGTQTLFQELIEYFQNHNNSHCIRDIEYSKESS